MMVSSSDDGQRWTAPLNLTRMLKRPEWSLLAPAPGHGITLEDGTLAASVQGRCREGGFSSVIFSRDHGRTWTMAEGLAVGMNESGIAQLSNGAIMLNGRTSEKNARRGVFVSNDLGKTWHKHPTHLKTLIEPSCQGSLLSYDRDGQPPILLFSNPQSTKRRERMTLCASGDQGMTWDKKNQLLLDEYGGAYSCLTTVKEGFIGILYESSQGYLVFQKVRIDEIFK